MNCNHKPRLRSVVFLYVFFLAIGLVNRDKIIAQTDLNLSGDWRDSHGGEIQIVQSGNQVIATGKNEAVTRWWDRGTATLNGQALTMTHMLAGQTTDTVSGTVLDSNRIQWNNNSTWQRQINLSGNWRDSHGGEIQIVQSGNQVIATGKNEAVTRWWDRATASLNGQSLTMTYTLAGQTTDTVSGTVMDSNRIQWNNNSTWQRYGVAATNTPAAAAPVGPTAPSPAVPSPTPALPVVVQTPSYTSNHPVYIVAHRCNSNDMSVVGGHGVNAIEADFRYGGGLRTTGWYLAHDDVLPSSPTLNEWLEAVAAEVRRPGSTLAMLYVDIKTPEGPLDEMFDAIQRKLPELYTIYDIGKLKEGKHLAKIKDRILNDPKAVAAMGFDDSPSDVNQFFKDNGYPIHKYWYEVGLAAAFQWSKKEEDWAKEAIRSRFAGTGPKVAIWTFEKESSVQSWLNEGVDAILVNSSKAYGRTTALVSDANVHVKNAKALTLPDKYASRSDNAVLDFGPAPRRYTVLIKTADKSGAGTDSNIDLEMWGWKDGREVYVGKTRLNPLISRNAFERNDTDSVVIQTRSDMGAIFKLKVSSDGRYPGSSWDLEWIKVDGKQFNFNTDLDGDSSTREIAKVNTP